MLKFLRTNASNPDFVSLVALLDADLAIRDGEDHDFYDQFNKLDDIKYAILVTLDEVAVGCGAIKEFNPESMEVKRMYTLPNSRGQGIASKTLTELESWASELGYTNCVLETGVNQPEAIALYKKRGYSIIPNYGQYTGVETSFCFSKQLMVS